MKASIKATLLCVVFAATAVVGAQQLQYLSGQSVQPYFEGWEQNSDGSFSMVFGYLNRNFREELNVPIGPNNQIEPANLEQTQPEYFYPRRHRYLFKVRVPKDWGKKDVIWTITANGKTEKAYAYIVPEQAVDLEVVAKNRGGGQLPAPKIELEGPVRRSVAAGQPLDLTVKLTLAAPVRQTRATARSEASANNAAPAQVPAARPNLQVAADDPDAGDPTPRGRNVTISDQPGVGIDVDGTGRRMLAVGKYARTQSGGVRVAWLQWRGPGKITFDPWFLEGVDDRMPGWTPPRLPPDGRVTTKATFSQPGTYIIRALGDTGGMFSQLDITVDVTGTRAR